MARVSVILTSFNHVNHLRDSIDSVLNQTLSDFELIIIDDASTDGSWEVISSYKDPRITAIRCSNHGEVLLDINDAIRNERRAAYIAIQHSDDIWEPTKLEKQVDLLDRNAEVGAVFSNALIIAEDGSAFSDTSHFYHGIFNQENRSRHEWLRFFFRHGNALCHPSAMIRRSCFLDCGVYDNLYFQLTDLDMWIRICLKYEIHVLPEKLIRFRVRDNDANASGNRTEARVRNHYEGFQICENYRKINTANDLYKIFPEAEEYHRADKEDLRFVLGYVMVRLAVNPGPRLFALELLREAIGDPIRERNIQATYGFDVMEFGLLTSQYDIFSLEEVSRLHREIAERDRELLKRDRQIAEQDHRFDERERQLIERDAQIAEMQERAAKDAWNLEAITAELAIKDQGIEKMKASLSWRVTRILRLWGQRGGSGS